MYQIVFISPTSSQPRYHKRVTQLRKFCNVEIFSFARGYYEENTFPKGIPFTSLGRISDRKYFRRIFSIFIAVFKIRKQLKYKEIPCLFYTMSFDCMLIARLCGLKHGYYEVGDLRHTEGCSRVFAFLEKLFLKNILGLVLTSRYFYEDFYKTKSILPNERIFIIDNKVNQSLAVCRPVNKKFSKGRIVIGLIGLLRYHRPIKLLFQFVRERPDKYRVECFGDGPLRSLVEANVCENIRYHGGYKSPEDLTDIYRQVDLNYVVYDNITKNVQLAIPNKLFESAFWGVPIVCCQNTSVGKLAVKWQVGEIIRIDSFEHFSKDLGSIDKAWLQRCSKNCFKLLISELLDNGEEIIFNMIREHIDIKEHITC